MIILYLETLDDDQEAFEGPDKKLIFFKFFDPKIGIAKPVGKLYVRPEDNILTYQEQLVKMIDAPAEAELMYFEEVKPSRTETITPTRSFQQNQLQTGDIICLQVKSEENASEGR